MTDKPNFNGLRVLSLESRMATSMEKLIEKFGGRPLIAPTLKETPLQQQDAAFKLYERLESGEFDLLILMTGVGFRYLLQAWENRYSKEEILKTLGHTAVVVRGPKPTQVCKANGIPIAVTVPPPNTWQEILQILTEESRLAGKKVALLEYGRTDANFLSELEGRGAQVTSLKIYRWELPEDTDPIRQAIRSIIAGEVDLLLQTSAIQILHLLQVTESKEEELALRRALSRVGIISIGPTTSAQLREIQIFPDWEVFPNKKETLVEEAARQGPALLAQKRARADESWIRLENSEYSREEANRLLQDSPMMRACRRQKTDRIPVWLMRQAGRYMAEYQLIRTGKDFLEFCKDPHLCTEATLSAVERLGVDAAIIFADILLILEPMGLPLAFQESLGPVIAQPVRTPQDIARLQPVDPRRDLAPTLQAVRQVRRDMHPKIPLIGFCGAPFTLAAYMIEGRGSRNYIPTKNFMHSEPKAWHQLMEKLVRATGDFLTAQVEAGCGILQVFDSWVGTLSPEDYRNYVFPHMKRLFSEIPAEVPAIHFGTGTATLLSLQKEAGGDVLGMDWRVDLAAEWERLGDIAVQGNFDPVLLFSKPEVFLPEVEKLLKKVGNKPGYIFNLGHGILPETPVDHVMALVDYVHQWKIKDAG